MDGLKTTAEKPALFLLFNHTLTEVQRRDARQSLGIGRIVAPPAEIKRIWSQVPPEVDNPTEALLPVLNWLEKETSPGDYLFVQGEFGATCIAVRKAFSLDLVPVYSTTRRQAVEERLADGRVEIRHLFCHVRYRRYDHD